MTGFFIALISGALMSVQGVFNTQVTKASGIWVANAFVQFTALLVCLARGSLRTVPLSGSFLRWSPNTCFWEAQSELLSPIP